jgi:hypothetical protein
MPDVVWLAHKEPALAIDRRQHLERLPPERLRHLAPVRARAPEQALRFAIILLISG